MAAVLMAPTTDVAHDDDSTVLAVVVLQGHAARTWMAPAAAANPKVQHWCHHALDGGQHIAVLTMLDLLALPPI